LVTDSSVLRIGRRITCQQLNIYRADRVRHAGTYIRTSRAFGAQTICTEKPKCYKSRRTDEIPAELDLVRKWIVCSDIHNLITSISNCLKSGNSLLLCLCERR